MALQALFTHIFGSTRNHSPQSTCRKSPRAFTRCSFDRYQGLTKLSANARCGLSRRGPRGPMEIGPRSASVFLASAHVRSRFGPCSVQATWHGHASFEVKSPLPVSVFGAPLLDDQGPGIRFGGKHLKHGFTTLTSSLKGMKRAPIPWSNTTNSWHRRVGGWRHLLGSMANRCRARGETRGASDRVSIRSETN